MQFYKLMDFKMNKFFFQTNQSMGFDETTWTKVFKILKNS